MPPNAEENKRTETDRLKPRPAEDGAIALVALGTREWLSWPEEHRQAFLTETDQSYRALLDEFFIVANKCVEQNQRYLQLHGSWRRRIIVSTGIVTIVNVLAASKIPRTSSWLPIAAAVCAAGLGILANLESFYDCNGRAQAYRESRELFLDAGREYTRLWESYVRPLGTTAEACMNASELYRLVTVKDRELRLKLKELTKTEQPSPSTKP